MVDGTHRALQPTPPQFPGLDSAEVARRLTRYGPNEPAPARPHTALRQLIQLLANPLTLTLLVASGVAAALGEPEDAVLIVTIVALSTLVNFAQHQRSQRAVERLRASTALTAMVFRDGRWQEVPRSQLVPGDVVRLVAGDLVPADCRLLEANHLFIQQASLTGESMPVEKTAVPEASPSQDLDAPYMVFLGSSVVSGFGLAEVVATGAHSVFGALARRLVAAPPETEFERGLREFSYFITRTVVFLVLFVLSVSAAFGRPPLDSLLFALALAVGLTPEFLPMVTTVALAQGAVRMARRRALVRTLARIEDLGSLDVLCTDKTGTLTEGEMRLDRSVDVDGRPHPRAFALAWLNSQYQGGAQNPLDAALLREPAPDWPAAVKVAEIPFDFERRRISVAVHVGEEVLLVTKGAPESVLPCCTGFETAEGVAALEEDARRRAAQTVAMLSGAGFRILAVAWRHLPGEEAEQVDVASEKDLVLAGFVVFADPPVPEAGDLMRRLEAQGVQVKLVTGDHELVAVHVWRTLGREPRRVVVGNELARLDALALERVAEEADIFARVSPAQKHQLVLALRRRGHVVGFLGDGINDAPSLHAADVGISVVGAADVAR
ncbi:MAG: HAD-IC family P-type ATPase, partial [Armatimonadota bacterium]|nr:HAD-IC family P-type ATPase [Armatimonadota bacterium]